MLKLRIDQTTVVSSLYDIGRADYEFWPRSHETYLEYFKNVLSLDSNFVVFVDQSDVANIKNLRGRAEKTRIIARKFIETPAYKLFYEDVKNVMQSKVFQDKISRLQGHSGMIELLYPEYDIVNFNKIYLVNEVVKENPFNSKYFMWLDAGYSHWRFPSSFCGRRFPNPIKVRKLDDNRIHILSICKEEGIVLPSLISDYVSITGSWFGGRRDPLIRLQYLFTEMVKQFLEANAINDDQAILAICYQRDPDLFSIEVGEWFESLKWYI